MENLLNYFFPTKCLFCGKPGYDLCPGCLLKCNVLKEQRCLICDLPAHFGISHLACSSPVRPVLLFSAFEYSGITRSVIKKAKYTSREFSALKVLSDSGAALFSRYIRSMSLFGSHFNDPTKIFTVVPAPVSKSRLSQRGFNQAELIAERVQKSLKATFSASFNYSRTVVLRSKNTEAQHNFTREERFLNVKDAFTANTERVKDSTFILVDDITTTGATLLEISKELYNKGATTVMCFALSKKLRVV
jgi:competence protein ComFC